MTEERVRVDPEVLRQVAGRLAAEAYGLAHGFADVPGLVVAAPQWRAGTALVRWESAAHAWLGALGARVAETAAALRAAADEYEAVDDRAAGRLAGLPR
ncbi:type VII secretion target [Micromonospora sp. CPCC 205711]|uniref:type VII secretion target n=1 Tax=Micromonospora sp. CPCC 205547 TaxID=3122400 RepID=UPI002FEFBA8E